MFDGREVSIVTIESGPWFVANDVCAILELANPRKAVGDLPQKGVTTSDIQEEPLK